MAVEVANSMRPDFGRTAQDSAERFPGDPVGVLERVFAVVARSPARGDG